MKTSATNAVVLNLAKLRTNASGRKISICRRMKYCIPRSLAQFVMAMTKAWRFSDTKMIYAATKPIWEIAIDERMARRM